MNNAIMQLQPRCSNSFEQFSFCIGSSHSTDQCFPRKQTYRQTDNKQMNDSCTAKQLETESKQVKQGWGTTHLRERLIWLAEQTMNPNPETIDMLDIQVQRNSSCALSAVTTLKVQLSIPQCEEEGAFVNSTVQRNLVPVPWDVDWSQTRWKHFEELSRE